jgi:hypothetical protein
MRRAQTPTAVTWARATPPVDAGHRARPIDAVAALEHRRLSAGQPNLEISNSRGSELPAMTQAHDV